MKGRPHHPHSAAGRTKGRTLTSREPTGIAPSWPAKGTQNATGKYRRPSRPTHPGCATDKHPHRTLTRQWFRDGWTLEQAQAFVRTKLGDTDSLGQRALSVYAAMQQHIEG